MPRWKCTACLNPEVLRRWPSVFGYDLEDYVLKTAQADLSPTCSRVTSLHVREPPDYAKHIDSVCVTAYGETD